MQAYFTDEVFSLDFELSYPMNVLWMTELKDTSTKMCLLQAKYFHNFEYLGG